MSRRTALNVREADREGARDDVLGSPPLAVRAHAASINSVADQLRVAPDTGLDPEEAERRASEHPNELPAPRPETWSHRILRQIRDPMAMLLIAAAGLSAFVLDEVVEAIAIVAIVILNTIIALAQEARAEQALAALRAFETPTAHVLRGGRTSDVPAREIAVGDVIVLREGDRVPADARLTRSHDLRVDEASLTGESLPVHKDADLVVMPTAAPADRVDTVFSGTLVARGTGRGIVTATGSDTELGRIAARLDAPRRVTPLQLELATLTRRLGAVAVLAAALAFALALVREGASAVALERTFLAAVALAVAAVPEGLATVVAVALALGVSRMAAQGAIVRRLPAVETLGATTVLATDKTGTLTLNRFEVVDAWIPGNGDLVNYISTLCNEASLDPPTGDTLEIALLRWVGVHEVKRIRSESRIVDIQPFDSDRKLMSVVVECPDGVLMELVKGAPEEVLTRCTQRATTEGREFLGSSSEIRRSVDDLAGEGSKVLGLAARRLSSYPPEEPERDLVFVGLIALGDPIRPEASGAVAEALAAGVSLVMVTGDHAATAESVARRAGLEPRNTITGYEIEERGMPEDPLAVSIYARATPDHKLRLVEALRKRGETVAVTGDGVNDAPALFNADIGVAMGGAGTEVAKEASDLVITDDNLATIVAAIREGRGIYDNVRRVVEYLIPANISEVAIVMAALLLFPDLAVPLLPLQLLWINLITDGLPAVALGLDRVPATVMKRPPRRRDDSLLGGARLRRLVLRGALLASSSLAVLTIAHVAWNEPWAHARALMFTSMAFAQLAYAFAVRRTGRTSEEREAMPMFSNRWLTFAAAAGIASQILIVTWSPAQELFQTAHLQLREWLLAGIAALVPSLLLIAVSQPERSQQEVSHASRNDHG